MDIFVNSLHTPSSGVYILHSIVSLIAVNIFDNNKPLNYVVMPYIWIPIFVWR